MSSSQRLLLFLFVGLVSASVCLAGETATLRNGFSIHCLHHENMGEVTRLFLTDSADSFVDVPTEEIQEVEQDSNPTVAPEIAPNPGPHRVDLDEALSAASYRYNLPLELVRSVVQVESAFNPNARSGKGAQGLMQLMPQTAWQMGVKNAMDPVENLEGGTRYLSQLLGRYNNDLPIALAAYNAGPQRVQQYHGIPPYRETIDYVNRVLRELHQPKATAGKTVPNPTHATKKPDAGRSSAVHVGKKIDPKIAAIPTVHQNPESAEAN